MKDRNLFTVFSVIVISAAFLFYGFESDNFPFQQKPTNKNNLPQNPLDGRIVFENYGCINCHSINGFGGKTATDFNSKNFLIGDFDLISEMWNHSPGMLKMIEQMEINQKKMTAVDFGKLRYFIYFLGYISNSGSVSKGEKLFTQMKCANCHSIGKTIPDKINLDNTAYYASPIYLAQVMWNHAAQMHKKQKMSNINVPFFEDNEFADLAAYLEAESILGERNKNFMYPGNPAKGEKLFGSKNCSYCHLQNAIGPNLSKIDLHKSVNEIAGMLWNHSNVMESAMTKNNISWPSFKNGEMGNLLAYLYFYNNKKVVGSIENGQKLLAAKGCLNCHYAGNSYNTVKASDIKPFDNIDEFFSEVWNHLPLIEKDYYSKGKEIPKLLPEDVKSMYLYFNRKNR